MAGKVCVRCGADTFGLVRSEGDIHVCKDIAKRLARRERQVQAVIEVFDEFIRLETLQLTLRAKFDTRQITALRAMSEAIVAKLAGMGVTEDA